MGQRHRLWQRLDGFEVYNNPWLAGLRGRIGIGFPDHFNDADNFLALVGVVKKAGITLFHRH